MIVYVVYATQKQQDLVAIDVPDQCVVIEAIELSGILTRFPEIDLSKNKIGIFGRLANLQTALHPKDRIEIYRPLTIDPKLARKLRHKSN